MKEQHYQDKSINYGIAHTRLNRILDLANDDKYQKILDVGCARGYIGRRLKKGGRLVFGVEMSSPAAAEAQKVLDKVYIFDIEKPWPPEVASLKFDLAIVAELLEHVFDPVEVLGFISQTLQEKGEIIITTPNFLTWVNRIKMLFGFFRYTEQGLLDFGHIRFFTYRYLKQVLTEAGFNVIKESHIIFPGKITRILKYWPSLFATQFIVKAKKL